MDIYSYAMKMEKDGEEFYRELAGKTDDKGLKSILGMLADAEVRHYNILRNMKMNEGGKEFNTDALAYLKNIFETLKDSRQFDLDGSAIELYKKAQFIEIQSREFYLDEAKTAAPPRRETFAKIADEEQRHYLILEDIITMVDKPRTWLETPEWYHLDEY